MIPAEPSVQRTDGVEVTLTALDVGEMQLGLFTRPLNPRDRVAAREMVLLKGVFTLEQPTAVELYFGPGPENGDLHNWIWLGRLVIGPT